MTACHFVAHLYFALLGDIHLGYLHNSGGKLITDGEVETFAFQFGIQFFVATQVVDYRGANEFILVVVGSPFVQLHRLKIDISEHLLCELCTFGNNVHIGVILHPSRCFTIG